MTDRDVASTFRLTIKWRLEDLKRSHGSMGIGWGQRCGGGVVGSGGWLEQFNKENGSGASHELNTELTF